MQNRRYIRYGRLMSAIAVFLCVTVLAGFSFKKAPVYEYNEQGKVTKATEYYTRRKVKSVNTYEYDSKGEKISSKTVYYKENGEVDYTYSTEYASGGKKKVESIAYSDGSARVSQYDENGNKALVYCTEFGVETYREEMSYDSGGRLILYTDYVDDRFRNSYSREYYPSGKVACEVFYNEDGEERGRRYYDEAGNIVDKMPDALESPAATPKPELEKLSVIRYPGKGVDTLREIEIVGLETTSGFEMTEYMEPVMYVCDGDLKTVWHEDVDGRGVGEIIVFYFGSEQEVDAISIFPGFFESKEKFGENLRPKTLRVNVSDGRCCTIELDDSREEHFYYFSEKVKTEYLEFVIKEVYTDGAEFDVTAISEITVYNDSMRGSGAQAEDLADGALISADYAENDLRAGEKHHYYSDGQEYSIPIVVRAHGKLKNVEFFKYNVGGDDLRPGEILYTLKELNEDKPLVVEVEFPGDLSSYGIRFVDEAGKSHTFAMHISGMDGSVVLVEE